MTLFPPSYVSILINIMEHGTAFYSPTPKYETPLSAGVDIRAALSQPTNLSPQSRALIPTAIKLQMPENVEAQIRSRSGLSLKHGVIVLNAPGTIDPDYREEIKIVLINHGDQLFTINPGDRIAQIVFAPILRASFQTSTNLSSTNRSGGFGSTGTT